MINTRSSFHVPVVTIASFFNGLVLDSFNTSLPQIQSSGTVRFASFAHPLHGVNWISFVRLQKKGEGVGLVLSFSRRFAFALVILRLPVLSTTLDKTPTWWRHVVTTEPMQVHHHQRWLCGASSPFSSTVFHILMNAYQWSILETIHSKNSQSSSRCNRIRVENVPWWMQWPCKKYTTGRTVLKRTDEHYIFRSVREWRLFL